MPKSTLTDDKPSIYRCTSCDVTVNRNDLTVKKALFQVFGRNGKWLRSRVVAWLCDDCLEADSDWNSPTTKGGTPNPPIGA